jgi:hypothetical protein
MAATVTQKTGRADPKRRRRDGASTQFGLRNQDPDRKYVWVYKNSAEQGVEYYEAIGWDTERLSAGTGALRPAVGKTVQEGQLIEQGGYILMSISKEDHEDLNQFGAEGSTGQDLFDKLEAKIINPKGGMDPARGMSSRYFTALNETKPNQILRATGDIVTD